MHSIYRLTVGFIAPLNSWFVPGDVLAPNDYNILGVMTYCHPIITTYQAEFLLKTPRLDLFCFSTLNKIHRDFLHC